MGDVLKMRDLKQPLDPSFWNRHSVGWKNGGSPKALWIGPRRPRRMMPAEKPREPASMRLLANFT